MKKINKTLIIGILSILVVLIIWVSRDLFSYYRYERFLHHNLSKVASGKTKEEVILLLGFPTDEVTNTLGNTLYWSTAKKQIYLFKIIGLQSQKGHYEIVINFDENNKVREISDGVQ